MKPTITWIVLADGDKAKVFEQDGSGKGLRAVKDANLEQDHLRDQDIMADRPGRSISSAGPGSRSAVGYHTDPVEARERRFVEKLAAMLDEKRTAGAYDRLVIAAAPAALGDLRPALTEQVRRVVVAELAKDLTNIPMPDLPAHFEDVLAV